MQRTVIASFRAWDAAGQSHADFAPGAEISGCAIRRHTQSEIEAGADPYSVHFENAGREYSCALALFQARTAPSDASESAGAVAV